MASGRDYQRSRSDYTIACICPKDVELAPVRGMLDRIHGFPAKHDPHTPISRPISGQNVYEFGAIGDHNVVIAIMPGVGNNVAAVIATHLLIDFPAIRFGLLVGIGGGVPNDKDDIRLGDVVVSEPSEAHGGVIQYDLGRQLPDGRFQRTGQLDKPPRVLLANMQRLRAQHRMAGSKIEDHLSSMMAKWPYMQAEYTLPTDVPDLLFRTDYGHQQGAACEHCSVSGVVARPERLTKGPHIHYGNIGSANIVVKDPYVRDSLKNDNMRILCVEMEAAGLMESFPSLVIRGIADYADSHKSDRWQPYAAAAAAAYMKEFLLNTPSADVYNEDQAAQVVTGMDPPSNIVHSNKASTFSTSTDHFNWQSQGSDTFHNQSARRDVLAEDRLRGHHPSTAEFDLLEERLRQTSLSGSQPHHNIHTQPVYHMHDQSHQSNQSHPDNQAYHHNFQYTSPGTVSGPSNFYSTYNNTTSDHSSYENSHARHFDVDSKLTYDNWQRSGNLSQSHYPELFSQQSQQVSGVQHGILGPFPDHSVTKYSSQPPPRDPWQTSQGTRLPYSPHPHLSVVNQPAWPTFNSARNPGQMPQGPTPTHALNLQSDGMSQYTQQPYIDAQSSTLQPRYNHLSAPTSHTSDCSSYVHSPYQSSTETTYEQGFNGYPMAQHNNPQARYPEAHSAYGVTAISASDAASHAASEICQPARTQIGATTDDAASSNQSHAIESSSAAAVPGPRSVLIIQCEQHSESKYTKYDAYPNEDLAFNLNERCKVIVANNSDDALDVFLQPHRDLLAVYFYEYNYRVRREREFAIDKQLMEAVLGFARQGGIVVINGRNIESDFDPFFKYECKFPWKNSWATSGFGLIRNNKFNARTFKGDAEVPKRWLPNQMALMGNVDPQDLLYNAESPRDLEHYETEGPVVVKRLGEGSISWYGIGCIKEPSQQVLFALLGLT